MRVTGSPAVATSVSRLWTSCSHIFDRAVSRRSASVTLALCGEPGSIDAIAATLDRPRDVAEPQLGELGDLLEASDQVVRLGAVSRGRCRGRTRAVDGPRQSRRSRKWST